MIWWIGALPWAVALAGLLALAWLARDLLRCARILATAGSLLDQEDFQRGVDALPAGRHSRALLQLLDKLFARLHINQQRLEASSKARSIATLATEVAHDIRSPVAALQTIVQRCDSLNPKYRALLHDATERVSDIANNLLTQYRGDPEEGFRADRPDLLPVLVHRVAAEKRLRFQGVHVVEHVEPSAYDAFVAVDKGQFKRALSNLLNNAMEAMSLRGRVDVRVYADADRAFVEIRDHGCGMSAEQLAQALRGGVSFGKEGHGIGLSSAVRTLQAWEGTCEVVSRPGEGTVVTLGLPRRAHPLWFASQVDIAPGAIAILDSDKFISELWEERLRGAEVSASETPLHSFQVTTDFLDFMREAGAPPALVLVDYQPVGGDMNGIDLIEALGLADRAILVTGHYDIEEVRARCEGLGLKILPKCHIPYAPIVRKGLPERTAAPMRSEQPTQQL